MDIRQALDESAVTMSYVHLWEQGGGVGKTGRRGRLLRESEILLGRWRNIGPGGNLRSMHLRTVFPNHIQVDFSCRIPMSAHDSLCQSISPARSIYLDSGKAVNSRDCFSKLGSHRKPSHYCQHSSLLFSTNVSGA